MKKALNLILAFVMLISVFAGCGQSAQTTQGSTSDTQKVEDTQASDIVKSDNPLDESNANIDWKQFNGSKIRVMMATHFFQAGVEPHVPEFEKLTGIDVQFESYPEQEFWNKLLIEFNGGSSAPDVFMLNYTNIPMYHSGGWIDPLTPYIDNAKITDSKWYDQADLLEKGVDFGTYADNYYGVPVTGEWQILYYRKDIYEQKGLKVPTTMDELYENCKATNSPEVSGIVMRCARASALWWPWAGFVRTYGSYWVEDGVSKLDSQESIDATAMYVKLLSDFGPSGIANYTYVEALTDFQQGRSAHFIDSSGFMAQMEDKSKSTVAGKVGYALMPAAAKGVDPVPNVNHWMLGLGKQSANKEAAWLFTQWATSKKMAKVVGLASGTAARTSIWEDADYRAAYPQEWIDCSLNSAKYADKLCIPPVPEASQLGDYLEIAVTELMSGNKDTATVMKDLAKKSNDLLSK